MFSEITTEKKLKIIKELTKGMREVTWCTIPQKKRTENPRKV